MTRLILTTVFFLCLVFSTNAQRGLKNKLASKWRTAKTMVQKEIATVSDIKEQVETPSSGPAAQQDAHRQKSIKNVSTEEIVQCDGPIKDCLITAFSNENLALFRSIFSVDRFLLKAQSEGVFSWLPNTDVVDPKVLTKSILKYISNKGSGTNSFYLVETLNLSPTEQHLILGAKKDHKEGPILTISHIRVQLKKEREAWYIEDIFDYSTGTLLTNSDFLQTFLTQSRSAMDFKTAMEFDNNLKSLTDEQAEQKERHSEIQMACFMAKSNIKDMRATLQAYGLQNASMSNLPGDIHESCAQHSGYWVLRVQQAALAGENPYQEAVNRYHSLFPGDWSLHEAMLSLRLEMKHISKAKLELEQLMTYTNDPYWAAYQAWFAEKEGDQVNTEIHLRQLLELEPKLMRAHKTLLKTLGDQEKYNDLVAHLKWMKTQSISNSALPYEMAKSYPSIKEHPDFEDLTKL